MEAAALLCFQAVGDARPGLGVAVLLAAFAPYVGAWMAARGEPVAAPLFLAATVVLLHGALLFQGPTLDDDLWRYRWDGKVVAAGHNPYLHPPAAAAVADLRDPGWERVSFKSIRTVYPPLAQVLFAGCYRLGDGALLPFRLAAVAGHLTSVALLALLLSGSQRDPRRCLLYAWNPLMVKEVADSGHVDPWMVVMVLAGLLAYQRRRPLAAALALGAGIGVKWVPLLMVPLWRFLGFRALGLAALSVVALLLPWSAAGGRMFDGLVTYADYWVFNPGLYWGLRGLLDPHLELATAKLLAKGFLAGLWLALYIQVARRQRAGFEELVTALFAVTGALLLLAPTLDPWYLTWVLPLACLGQGRLPTLAWWWLSAGACLSYLFYMADRDVAWGRWVEYVVFALLWAAEWWWLARRSGGSPPVATPSRSSQDFVG
jgi:hypothetical protein